MTDINFVAVFGFLISLFRSFVVVALAWFTLRWLDYRMGFVFKTWWSELDGHSKAIYLSARCFAVFLAFSICMA
ncbi:hypothetical protein [Vibrio aerogenes]|uniref:hypothetical protein n=1 Tax=Vibrio aerogenes TaxID=92172 RepID=UPI001114ABF3|nr:hypothetical protein [Vibrio aerogenes]